MRHYRATEGAIGLQKHPWSHNDSLDMSAERELASRKDGNNGKSSVCEWNDSSMFRKGSLIKQILFAYKITLGKDSG